jgi:segregation and condensation protein B
MRREKKQKSIGDAQIADSFRHPPLDEGLSLDSISQAFAAMLTSGDDPYQTPPAEDDDALLAAANQTAADGLPIAAAETDTTCPVNPRSILEAMLFVGTPDDSPLTSAKVAGMMRGVSAAEIDDWVADLNRQYSEEARPYSIEAVGPGYRLKLRDEFSFIRERLYGSPRAVRLSPAAVEVLAIVAYNEPVTAEQVGRMRGTPSGPILTQLVRRRLIRLERGSESPRAAKYFTTDRFLQVFRLGGLDELPQSREIE